MAKCYPTIRPNGSITIYYIHGSDQKTHFFINEVLTNVKAWDKKAKAVKDSYPNSSEINTRVKYYWDIVEQIKTNLVRENQIPTVSLVKMRYEQLITEREKQTRELESGLKAQKNVLFDPDIVEDEPTRKIGLAWAWWKAGKGKKKAWKHSSKRTIKQSLDAFETFLRESGRGAAKLLLPHMTVDLVNEYETYLFDKGQVKNAVGKRLKHLRQFLQTVDGLPFDPGKIQIYNIEKTPIALTEAELTKLENIVLQDKREDEIRDLFLLGCYTSLRISDLSKLNKQHFQGDRIQILQQKNERLFKFPITTQIRGILEKYEYKLPRYWDAHINETIKVIAEKAGINQEVEITKEFKDVTIRITKKKYEVISTHMAVKTFITLALSWGMSIPDIAAIVEKHVRTIQAHYAAGDKDGAAEKLRDLWERRQHLKVV